MSDKKVIYVKEKRRWNIGGFIILILSTIVSYKEKNLDFSPRLLTDNLNYIF